ncbi:hypothetical protein BDZ45DRAFT_499142 [Acephala macrosclerotiorum]|nr:hypothetical protein BDZ45DRAFT_499142 [Acephala macrosclerotiorum]
MHRAITAKITPFSATIPIYVGADKQLFHVQKGLLTLHSLYFRNRFKDRAEGDEEKPFLRAPAFQNVCMDDCRKYCKDPKNEWPVLSYVELMYRIGAKGSKLRLFAAHSVVRRHPFEKFEEGSEEYRAWDKLFEKWPDLLSDINKGLAKKWNGAFPWDDELRDDYMEKERELDQEWEEQILLRGLDNIKKDAKKKCVRSIIELDHLQSKGNRGRA